MLRWKNVITVVLAAAMAWVSMPEDGAAGGRPAPIPSMRPGHMTHRAVPPHPAERRHVPSLEDPSALLRWLSALEEKEKRGSLVFPHASLSVQEPALPPELVLPSDDALDLQVFVEMFKKRVELEIARKVRPKKGISKKQRRDIELATQFEEFVALPVPSAALEHLQSRDIGPEVLVRLYRHYLQQGDEEGMTMAATTLSRNFLDTDRYRLKAGFLYLTLLREAAAESPIGKTLPERDFAEWVNLRSTDEYRREVGLPRYPGARYRNSLREIGRFLSTFFESHPMRWRKEESTRLATSLMMPWDQVRRLMRKQLYRMVNNAGKRQKAAAWRARAAFKMYFLEGRTIERVAEQLNVDTPTALELINHAIRKFREASAGAPSRLRLVA